MQDHKHLVFTGVSNAPPRDPAYIKAALLQLVDRADMEVFMEPQAKYCEDPTNAGVTGTVVITTSHSSVHVWDYGLVQADLYSCKDFDQDDIGEFIAKLYNCQDWDIQMYDRRPGPRLTALIERNALQAA